MICGICNGTGKDYRYIWVNGEQVFFEIECICSISEDEEFTTTREELEMDKGERQYEEMKDDR
jgi:hypothetical protein